MRNISIKHNTIIHLFVRIYFVYKEFLIYLE